MYYVYYANFKERKKAKISGKTQENITYEDHPVSYDNGLISQKLLLKPEFYYPLHVAMGVAYSCLKFGVFITT